MSEIEKQIQRGKIRRSAIEFLKNPECEEKSLLKHLVEIAKKAIKY